MCEHAHMSSGWFSTLRLRQRPPGPVMDPVFPPPRIRAGDVVAGVAVALVLIPQSLAYAEIAGLPAYVGLFAAALPPVAAAIVASSPYLQTGPVAMTALLTYGALKPLATPGTGEYIALAALLALVVGIVRVIIGLVGAGVISYFMSRPVVVGFTSGAAILIVASQIPTLFGAAPPDGKILYRAGWALGNPDTWDWPSIVLALVAALVIEIGRRIDPRVPGILIAVGIGLVYGSVADFAGPAVADVPAGLPPFSLALPWSSLLDLLLPGVVIALVGFAEASAISRTYATQDRASWDANREFVSQGLANLASGVSGGFPVGGSFSRSSINKASGAKTRWSGAITGLAVLAFLPIAGILEPLPRSVLAAIVIVAVVRLIRPDELFGVIKHSPAQGLVGLATFALVLLLAPRIDHAVLIGIGMGIIVHLVREMRVDLEARIIETTLRLRPGGVLYFASVQTLNEEFTRQLQGHPEAERLEIDLSGAGRLDYTSAVVLKQLADDAGAAGLEVRLVNVPYAARRIVDAVWGK